MNKNRVLFISHSGTNNGAVRILIQLIDYFRKNSDHEIDILIQDPVEKKIIEELSQNGNIFKISNLREIKKRKYLLFIQIQSVMVMFYQICFVEYAPFLLTYMSWSLR